MRVRFPTFLSRSAVAGASALGLAVTLGAGMASAASQPSHGAAGAGASALALLRQLRIGGHATDHAVIGHTALNGTGLKAAKSTNWSGYVDTHSSGAKYSKITGKWTEPRAKCGSQTSLAAFWVGIDGDGSDTVEQDGTLIECVSGTPHYFTWWEMYPKNNVQAVGRTLKPGDKISASVVRSGTKYKLKVTDATHPADSFTKSTTCAASRCSDVSAEWIAEAPSGSNGVYPLSKFGTWALKGATVTRSGKAGRIKSFPHVALTMVKSSTGAVEAKPSALNRAGSAFKVTWKSA